MTSISNTRFVLLVIVMSVLTACNLPRFPSSTPSAPQEEEVETRSENEEETLLSNFLIEEFVAGFPTSWLSQPAWESTDLGIQATNDGQSLTIPGVWEDMTLFLTFRHTGEGAIEIYFHGDGSVGYIIALVNGELISYWEAAGTREVLKRNAFQLDDQWHAIAIGINRGTVIVRSDSHTLMKLFNADLSTRGDIRIVNQGPGTTEIDRLVIGPAGTDQGSAATPALPSPAVLDLSIFELSVEDSGELVVGITNGGPDPTLGHSFTLSINAAGTSSAIPQEAVQVTYRMEPEYVNAFYVNTGQYIDLSQDAFQVTIEISPLDFEDPDTSNNSFSQDFSNKDN